MEFKIVDSSNIIYGCMQLAQSWDSSPISKEVISNAFECINSALENGINYFDHADIYCHGKSEKIFSEYLRSNKSIRDKIILQSKCGIRFQDQPNLGDPQRYDFSYDYIISSVEGILERLDTDYLDVLLLHRPDILVELEEVAKAFDELKSSGKVLNFGVSNHNSFQIELFKKYLDMPIVINQIEYNLLHNDLVNEGITVNYYDESQNLRNRGLLEYCRLNNIELQAWSPLAKGELANPKNVQLNKLMSEISIKYNIEFDALALAWILRHPANIKPVIGTIKPERILSSTQALKITLTREEWYNLFITANGRSMP